MIESIINLPTHLLVVGSFLSVLVTIFLSAFLMPGIWHLFRLRGIQLKLQNLQSNPPLSEFEKIFTKSRRLSHLWREYQDTLHKQHEERDGRETVVAVRETVPAEIYFNNISLVDSWLKTEFFKHLPGIFTGIGIIGTFVGLINGLKEFQVTENAAMARASLESLMHAVGDAFLISASAIIAAMVVTLLEKLLLASLYHRAEEISHAIDARFDAGAGEEYLSRLVKASEESASQSKILKDALVKELGDLLRDLTASQVTSNEKLHQQLSQRIDSAAQAQVDAGKEDSRNLADALGKSIKESLKEPLDDIAATVKVASGDQSSTAVRMLNDVMVSFSQRLNDLFGGQIDGINSLNQQTAQSMQNLENSLNTLIARLEESGKKSTDEMAAQMAASIKSMEERQAAINNQTQIFVEQIQQLVGSTQVETQQKLQNAFESIGQQMTNILTALGDSQNQIFKANQTREELVAERNKSLVAAMTEGIEDAVKIMAATSRNMAESVSKLSASTSSSVEKMNVGAERLSSAASKFATAGDRVSNVLDQVTAVSSKLAGVSGALTAGAGAVQEALRDYRIQRDAVAQLLAEVKVTVELARKEASLTGEALHCIEQSASKLGEAQKAADEYLDGVSHVLAKSSEAFRESVLNTLGKVNHDFHAKLSSAVGLLSTAVQELEVSLASVGMRQ